MVSPDKAPSMVDNFMQPTMQQPTINSTLRKCARMEKVNCAHVSGASGGSGIRIDRYIDRYIDVCVCVCVCLCVRVCVYVYVCAVLSTHVRMCSA